jgi:spore coat protein A
MRFRVIPSPGASGAIPSELGRDYQPPAPDTLAGAPRRSIALVERELDGEPNMLTMRELGIAPDDYAGRVVTVTDNHQVTRYRAAAAHFEDATTFFPVLGRYEVWQLINLTNDTHPVHVHLDPFQILSRRPIRYQILKAASRSSPLPRQSASSPAATTSPVIQSTTTSAA